MELVGDDTDYPIAASYSRFVASMGFRPMRDEHLVESLARSGHVDATKTQRRLGEDLLALLGRIKAVTTSPAICLSGGLFFNTYFTSLAASAGIFEQVYVPAHPGRNGAALGAALMLAGSASDHAGEIGSPYLGPSYTDAEIKQTIENCKLSFDLLHDERMFDVVLHALSRGRLIGWYHGRLEWGPARPRTPLSPGGSIRAARAREPQRVSEAQASVSHLRCERPTQRTRSSLRASRQRRQIAHRSCNSNIGRATSRSSARYFPMACRRCACTPWTTAIRDSFGCFSCGANEVACR